MHKKQRRNRENLKSTSIFGIPLIFPDDIYNVLINFIKKKGNHENPFIIRQNLYCKEGEIKDG